MKKRDFSPEEAYIYMQEMVGGIGAEEQPMDEYFSPALVQELRMWDMKRYVY